MQFRVTIQKKDAPEETRVIEAESRFAVYGQVEQEGGSVIALEEARGSFGLPAWTNIQFGTGIKRDQIVRLTKNMAAMLNAGLSLSRALSVIERQSSNKYLKRVVSGLTESVKKGSSFNEALAKYPKVFPPIFIAMAKAGEESGTLPDALLTVGMQMERSAQLTKKIKGAMMYPSIVISAVVVVGVLMMIYVVPTLTRTFASLGANVPLATRIVVAISNFMVAHVILVFIGLIVLFVGGYLFVRSERGSAIVLWVALRLPVIGELVRETFSARFARALSSLLSSNVPVLDALQITKEVVHARAFADVIDEAMTNVKKGEPLSASFVSHERLYPILMSDMLSVGEETGKVAEMLKQIAEFYEEDVQEKTKDLSTIIEPLLMLLIGSFVGVFAVSMIAPIYQLSSAI